MSRILIILLLITITLPQLTKGQKTSAGPVESAVPFMTISPDSRGAAMGDVGAATRADINSQFWNPAKYAFATSTSGIALSYTPWLRNLGITDMNLAYLSGYHQLDDLQSLSGSLRYFDMGSIDFFNKIGDYERSSKPNEFSVDLGYALKLSDNWSGSVALRYIFSDIFQSVSESMTPGQAFASDVAFFYTKSFFKSRKESNASFGVNISNIGSKISYNGGSSKDFIPTNLRIGGAYTTEIDKYNKMSFALDLNKLLVPTPPYTVNESGLYDFNLYGNEKVGPIEGIFKSFTDSPGGFKEELQEITISLGTEYWYSEQFALRAGYFNEHKDKGDRKFATFGAGLKMNVFSIDFSYIVALTKSSPLGNTLRFTLGFDLESFGKQGRKR